MKYFIIAGEASGDMHASHLMRELKKEDSHADFLFFGGDLMLAEGGAILKHYREMAFMGLINVILNICSIQKNFALAKAKLLEYQPDVLILVDYPGFNLRMAAFAKRHNIRTFYYISPKIWAWKKGRVRKVKKYIDEMFTIFPFESDFYSQFNYPVRYVGNPTVDELARRPNQDETLATFIERNRLPNKPVVALLAGSRRQEIQLILPVLLSVAKDFPEWQFVIAGAPSQPEALYRRIGGDSGVPVVFGQTYELLQQADAALVASGTATLETAVLRVPQVVCYRTEFGWFATVIKKLILTIPWFSLVNLIMDKEIVKEYFQGECNRKTVGAELNRILVDSGYRINMLENYSLMLQKLGGAGCAERAAIEMVQLLKSK